MKFEIQRETLLKPLQQVIGVVERRQTMPVLANLLIEATSDGISVTATDLEVELVAHVAIQVSEPGSVTVPARKLADICRALPEGAAVKVVLDQDRVSVKSGRSRFTLTTLPAEEFPRVEDVEFAQALEVGQAELRELIERTHFAMAQQDVRYYLNGLLLEVNGERLRAVATDGHRLALCDGTVGGALADGPQQVIVPRKGVQELLRLLEDEGDPVKVQMGTKHIRVELAELRFTSKLIDGRFPDYERVVPEVGDKRLEADREHLRQALARASILSNEKYRGVRFNLESEKLRVQAQNPEQEEAEEELEVDFTGDPLEIGFNVAYLLEALRALRTERIEATMTDPGSSCLIREPGSSRCRYVVMPMRL